MSANILDTCIVNCYYCHNNSVKWCYGVAVITQSGGRAMGAFDWDLGFQGGRTAPGGTSFSTGGSSHLIRSAERLAASGRFDFAIEQLAVAQRLDPENRYIQAIMDRIRIQQNFPQGEHTQSENPAAGIGKLAITVGSQFAHGLRSFEDDSKLAPEDVPTKIRFLTNMADQYLENGSSEKAFDSLMKAYLLDPLSPYVLAAEKTVLPVWNTLRRQTNGPSTDHSGLEVNELNTMSNIGSANMTPPNSTNLGSPFNPGPSRTGSLPQTADDQQRMDMLKQQKEQERLEKERTVWREASQPPKIFGEDDPANLSSPQQPQEQSRPRPTGLFSKLRLGKFLE